jgi:hypothetical protein
MDEAQFRELLTDHLLPLFPGIRLGKRRASNPRQPIASSGTGHLTFFVKPLRQSPYRIPLERSQPFQPDEQKLIRAFSSELSRIVDQADEDFFEAILESLPARVITKHVGWASANRAIREAIQYFESLSSQTYEGKPIVSALGITSSIGNGVVKLKDLWVEDFARVLSNGFDTIFVSGSDGQAFDFDCLPPLTRTTSLYAPQRLSALAQWALTNKKRLVLALNRNGEVLVFRDSKLEFAKRRGKWTYFPHEAIVKQMGTGMDKELRAEVYKSCLDASFARTGACICLAQSGNLTKVASFVDPGDLLEGAAGPKTQLLRKAIDKPFHKLDRRLRQEMLAVDGATVLDHTGKVLAVGAIVKVPRGSKAGGGRKAAARALSKLGLAIKVSADGPIEGFRKRRELFTVGGARR